jgi:heptosyltransferase-2
VENAVIHYLTKEQYKDILSPNPYIDRLWLYSDNMNEILKQLEAEDFDYIIDLHHNIRTFRIKNKLRKLSFSFDKLNFRKWLLVNFKVNKLPDIHIVERYLNTVKIFDVHNDKLGLDYFLLEEKTGTENLLYSDLPSHYIAIVIGAQHITKKAPAELLSEICDKLNYPVILLGGKDDTSLAESILKKVSHNKNVMDATGKLSLNQSALMVKNAELVITNDTGLMHIAAAFKKKIISIWGNTIPGFGMYPYLSHFDSQIFEIKDLNCRPCSKIGYQSCPKRHFKCMKNQNSDEISIYAKKLLPA